MSSRPSNASQAALAQAVAVLERELRAKLRGDYFETGELRSMIVAVFAAVEPTTAATDGRPWRTFDPRREARQAVTDAVNQALSSADAAGARTVTDYAADVSAAVRTLLEAL